MFNCKQAKFKKLTMADNQDNYGNGDEMHHDNEYNGNGGMDGQDNSYDQQQHSNGNNDNSGRDDDRWVQVQWSLCATFPLPKAPIGASPEFSLEFKIYGIAFFSTPFFPWNPMSSRLRLASRARSIHAA